MKKGQTINVTNVEFMEQVTFFEVVILGNGTPSFTGEILAVDPTKEELATMNENFEEAFKAGALQDVEIGIVYFDAGANRAFLVDHEDVALLN